MTTEITFDKLLHNILICKIYVIKCMKLYGRLIIFIYILQIKLYYVKLLSLLIIKSYYLPHLHWFCPLKWTFFPSLLFSFDWTAFLRTCFTTLHVRCIERLLCPYIYKFVVTSWLLLILLFFIFMNIYFLAIITYV